MAKRTRLTAPSADDLAKLEADFRSENRARPNPAAAPIAQVASESAALSPVEPAQTRIDKADAAELRRAKEAGLLIAEIPTDRIDAHAMVRDRTVIEREALDELKLSIRANGLRLPIEVYQAEEGGYHLLSGYRRLMAVQELAELNDGDFTTIKALIRPRAETADAFVAMVEENEVRADLSQYERGRIAVIAASQGAFVNTEAAIAALYRTASAAKRSKVKSFAEIHEVLGDLLKYADTLTERRGLRLYGALRQGGEGRLRDVLDGASISSPEEEWAMLEAVITEIEEGPLKVAKRGRPKLPPKAGWDGKDTIHLSSGVTIRKERTPEGFVIRLAGDAVNDDLLEVFMAEFAAKFDAPTPRK